jgi:hypothetical protein
MSKGAKIGLGIGIGCFSFILIIIALIALGNKYTSKLPVITLTSPENNITIQKMEIEVKGKVEPVNSEVTVNGEEVKVNKNDGSFSTKLEQLSVGETKIVVVATSGSRQSVVTRVITRKLSAAEEQQIKEYERMSAEQKAKTEQEKSSQNQPCDNGKIGCETCALYLNNSSTIHLATNKENYDRLTNLLLAHDNEGVNEMLLQGKLFTTETGVKVRIIDVKWGGATEVRLIEGYDKGKSGWINSEFLK